MSESAPPVAITLPSPQTATPPPSRRWRADIQALRALAVVLVVAFHIWPQNVPGGFVGVDVFFVVSGFVVGGALIREASSSGRVAWGPFVARRTRRLAPAALVTTAVVVVASALLMSPLAQLLWGVSWTRPSVVKDAMAAVLGVPNLWFMAQQRPYGDDGSSSPLLHFWSLGVELQFYVVMPLLALALAWAMRRQRLAGPVAAFAILVVLVDVMLLSSSSGDPARYFSPVPRLWEFWVGAMATFVVARVGRLHLGIRSIAAAASWVALVLFALLASPGLAWPSWWTAVPVAAAVTIIAASANGPRASAAMGARAVQAVGDASYAAYLVHWPIIVIGGAILGRSLGGWDAFWVLALTVGATAALHVGIERPFRRVPVATTAQRRRILVAGAAATACVLVIAALMGVRASSAAISTDAIAVSYQFVTVADRGQPAANVVPVNARPTLAGASTDVPRSTREECNAELTNSRPWPAPCIYGHAGPTVPVILLIGDSHAQQWLEALIPGADAGRYVLVAATASGCSLVDGVQIPGRDAKCEAWREWSRDQMQDIAPDLVLASGWLDYDGPDGKVSAGEYATGISEFLAKVPSSSALAWIADTPHWSEDPLLCLAEKPEDTSGCALAREDALSDEVAQAVRLRVVEDHGTWIDLNDYLCSSVCPPILDDVVVYRDDDHMTSTFARELAPAFEARLATALAGVGG